MPCRYVIDKQRRVVVSTVWDRVTFADAKRHQDQLAGDPDFDHTFNQLIDATAVTAIDATSEEIRTLGSRNIFSSTSRRALVATHAVTFGVARMMQAYLNLSAGGEQASAFYSLEEAEKWLGLPPK